MENNPAMFQTTNQWFLVAKPTLVSFPRVKSWDPTIQLPSPQKPTHISGNQQEVPA